MTSPSYTFQWILSIITHDVVFSNVKIHFMLSKKRKNLYIINCFNLLQYKILSTRGYPKIRGLFKCLLNVNVYCNENLSAYIVEYYQHILKGTVNFVNK
jgi:hypothetical protein